jgi:hypothetical protein
MGKFFTATDSIDFSIRERVARITLTTGWSSSSRFEIPRPAAPPVDTYTNGVLL